MDKSLFVERMLGAENLTDELEDSQADWLIKWGIARLDQALLLAAKNDPEAAGNQANALMAVVRKINRMAGRRQAADPESLANEFAALNALFDSAFGGNRRSSPEEYRQAAERLAAMDAQPAVEFLTEWGKSGSLER